MTIRDLERRVEDLEADVTPDIAFVDLYTLSLKHGHGCLSPTEKRQVMDFAHDGEDAGDVIRRLWDTHAAGRRL